MKKKILSSSCIAGLLFTQACSSTFADRIAGQKSGYMQINADAAGLQEFGNLMVGLTNEAKTPPEAKSSYFQHEEIKTKARAFTVRKPRGAK